MGQQVTYLASNSNLRIAWPYAVRRNTDGKHMVNRSVKFKEGLLRLDSDEDEKTVEMLDNHKGNRLNGGTSFRKQSKEIDALAEVQKGNTFAAMPEDGIQESDTVALVRLASLKASMPPNTHKKTAEIASTVFDRFSLAGLPSPEVGLPYPRLRARIIEMLATLEERGIWSYGDTEGKEHPGQGAA